MMKITEHFTRKEMTATNTGLYNEPSQSEFANLYDLCFEILEPVRKLLSDYKKEIVTIKITSGYRSEAVNKKVRSKAKNSQHLSGSAADFIPVGMMLTSAFELIKKSNIQYDQLILENGWIHISYSKNPRRKAFLI